MVKMQRIADEPDNDNDLQYNSDDYSSDSSGNKSDNDEMN